MHPHLQKQLDSEKNNQTKRLFKELVLKLESTEAAEELLNEFYSEYRKQFNTKQYNEKEFCDFVQFLFAMMSEEEEKLSEMADDLSKSHLYTIKVCISDYKNIYRTIQIPSVYFVSDLVHCALASFDLITLEPYIVEFKGANFYDKYSYEEISEENLVDNEFCANNMPLEFLELSKGKKIEIDYGYGSWIIECEVLSSKKNKEVIEEPLLIDGKGQIVPYDDMETTVALLKENYQELLDLDYPQEQIDEMKNIIQKPLNIEELKEYFPKAYYVLCEHFENHNLDDEELEFIDKRQERNDKLDEKDHIKTYNKAREILVNLIPKLVNEFERNKEKYIKEAHKIFDNRLKVAMENQHDILLHSFEIEGKDVDNIFTCYMFPIAEGYESVSQYLLKTNKIKNSDERKMLEAAIKSKVGIYKITYNNIEDALINVMDVKTNETITIVDKNLSFGLEHFDGQIYICGRIINYNKVNFMSNAIVLVEDKDVKQLVRDVKNNNYTSLDYFQKALIIQNKQGN